jgi:hypothetical protein
VTVLVGVIVGVLVGVTVFVGVILGVNDMVGVGVGDAPKRPLIPFTLEMLAFNIPLILLKLLVSTPLILGILVC